MPGGSKEIDPAELVGSAVTKVTAVEVDSGGAGGRFDGQAKTKKGARRRDAIIAAASDLFRDRGFHATSLDDIGAVAGISGPAIYRYFESKHDLLATLIEEAAIAWRATVDGVLNTDGPPLTTLERLIDGHDFGKTLAQHRFVAKHLQSAARRDHAHEGDDARHVNRLHHDTGRRRKG